jgi:hypothetical protein
VFQLGAARFGVALCAEGEVDFPWTEAVAGGSAVVFFCAAPGLDGRRTDERGWREGHAWWVASGLGDAVRHARRLAVPVAVATQAGSTEDEDFPGLAALVSRAGEVARLPDWRPGSLVVEVDADVTVQPVREAVRCLVVDHAGRALLFRDDLRLGPWIGRRCVTFWLGRWMTQRERWLLCRAEPFDVDPAHLASLSTEAIQELRWWSAEELRSSQIVATPRDLPDLLDRIARGDLPDADQDLGT